MRSTLVALATLALASSAEATRLFATNGTGLYEIDPTTAASQFIGPTGLVYFDIAGRLGDATHVYGVARQSGPASRNVVSTIDIGSGSATELFDFFPADFGFGANQFIEMRGISIGASDPSSASIAMAVLDFSTASISTLLFDLDLGTGAVSNLVTVPNNDYAEGLTETPDETLYTLKSLPDEWRPSTLDRTTGQLTELPLGFCASAPPVCSDGSIEFDPDRGELLVAERGGELVRLSLTTGEILGVVGPTGLNFVNGLAFLPVPEPGTGALLMIGLAGYGLAARRARSGIGRGSDASR